MNPNSAPPAAAAAAPAAAAPGETAAHTTAYAPPNVTAQQIPGQQPPGTIYIQTYGPQTPVYNTHQAVSHQTVPFVSIVSPEDNRKIRKMQCLSLGFSLLQLACSITIILVVRYHLAFFRTTSTPYGGVYVEYLCLAATPAWTGMCEYAYALACTSILFCFILSLMQCLTMDCCGMGRGMEAIFDFIMAAWWTAGTVTLGVRADEANKMGIPNRDARNSVVALSAISALLFWVLMITNIVLIKRLGKAYKNAHQQTQQHMTAHLPGIPTATYQHPGMPASTPAGPAGPTNTIAQETGAYPVFSKDAVSKV